jgi:hypothetical protein
LEAIDLGGYCGYYASQKLYLMDQGFKTENLVKLLEKIDKDTNFNPTSVWILLIIPIYAKVSNQRIDTIFISPY